eukprot:CAMPEP_0201490046 /NCGR_PEP_ID=MMETSP0151_2-20130828/24805_1 /ASSEMBLY_ACC=CAM_ASM_000257 /TAXON_ID=200890 /ORGANISM="Paramoeba atlantica, Strain 621/1 / CCAP 1560/9" /LENGTH=87 /DNA_ID=CAMNT_0047875837 /DNA_START=1229 /DNA_END=1489 /DNA_ORIENTATION=+
MVKKEEEMAMGLEGGQEQRRVTLKRGPPMTKKGELESARSKKGGRKKLGLKAKVPEELERELLDSKAVFQRQDKNKAAQKTYIGHKW